ncbi:hypothetical protein L195_g062161, partial [Trifolium pratense]
MFEKGKEGTIENLVTFEISGDVRR